ncbi:glycosyltransferase family 4 protein [Natronococcus pandeyae]|uniref:glycosyltransferase family 4 protein n=1 Tax=Natronococcus pandeyae TaxID=2055836 RepID=UPI001653390C|nr:glycosyltransferase family 1 protein [Natronococcus pandeyae]
MKDQLQAALSAYGVVPVDDWRDADLVHLFQDFILTTDNVRSFRFPALFQILYSETPLVVSTDDLFFTDRPDLISHPRFYGLHHRTNRWMLERADAIAAYSESVAREIGRYVDSTDLHVVHLAVDDRFCPTTSNTDTWTRDDQFVFHASLASKRKNPEAIVAVAERLDEQFVIAGTGWEEIVPERLRRRSVDALGYVSDDRLAELYRQATVFYFPTRHEGFGLPVLEAMASGTAVVTTTAYSVPEVVGDAAIQCHPEDVDAHVEQIRSLLHDDERRAAIERAALKRADQFSWDRAATETMAVYRELL